MSQPRRNYELKETFQGGTIPALNFKDLIKSLPDPSLLLDTGLRIIEVNDAYLKATMTKRAEIVGRHLFEVFPDNPADPQATGVRNLRASLNSVLQSRAPDAMAVQKYDIRRPAEQGGGFEERYWSPLNWPVLDLNNEILFIVHRVQDVTDFVRAAGGEHEHLRAEHAQLEADILARSREVADANFKLKQANEELARLNKKIEEMDKLKTTFFANVSHELRTPLTLILGPVEKWLKTGEATEEQKHDLEVVKRNALLLLRHVNDLLDISKLEAGAMVINYSDVDLANFIRFIASAFDSLAEEKRIRYTVHAPETVKAQVDTAKCQRIMFNLLSNAVKYTPPEGALAVSLGTEGGQAVIRVRDSGPGVPAHMREAVFDRYKRLETSATRRSEGTGLGLAIVKEFAELHHGSVSVEEADGGGALFTVRLPLAAPAGAAIEPRAATFEKESLMVGLGEINSQAGPAPSEKTPEAPPDAPVVLVVDDNRDMNAFEGDLLSRKYRVVSAFDGEEGLKKAFEIRPDLIVSDVMMPLMTGDRMIRELRSRRDFDDTPVLLITAKADEEFLVKMLKEGVQAYFRKPFSPGELMAHADGLIREKKLKEALRESEEILEAIMEYVPEGLSISDAEGIVTKISKYGIELSGMTREEFEGSTAEERRQKMGLYKVDGITPADIDDMPMMKVLRTGEPLKNWELVMKRGDGRVIPILSNAGPVKDKSGNIKGTVHVWRDIAELKQAERALLQALSEAEQGRSVLNAMMEHIPMGITIADAPEVTIREVSRFGRQLTGRPREELEGIPVGLHAERWEIYRADGLTPADNEELPLTRATQKGEIVQGEEWVLGSSRGTRIPILCTAAPIRDKSGRITGGVIGWQDIRERKRTEKEREQLISELRRSNDELQQFAYVASHDLQEPLRTMRSYLEILGEDYQGKLDTTADKYINYAVDGANRMTALINDLLAYSRVGSRGKKFEPISLGAVFGNTLRNLQQAIKENNAEITTDELPEVEGDDSQLTQLFQNLIGNALKFRKKDELVRIHVSAEERPNEWILGVHDNGIGIEPSFLAQIFDVFRRLHTKEEYAGTGIGLAVSKRIVERHGGRIWVESAPGKGSSFYFSLPKR